MGWVNKCCGTISTNLNDVIKTFYIVIYPPHNDINISNEIKVVQKIKKNHKRENHWLGTLTPSSQEIMMTHPTQIKHLHSLNLSYLQL